MIIIYLITSAKFKSVSMLNYYLISKDLMKF